MEAFARLVIRFRWPILAIWLIVVAVLVVTAPFGPAFSEHGNTNPLPSSAPSLQAQQLLAKHFRATQPQAATFTDYVILVDPHGIRSVLGVIAPLLSIGIGSAAGMAIIAHAGVHTPLLTASFTPQLVPVVTLGAGTNYSLFLMSRYREELERGIPHRDALVIALTRIGSAISASALTVIVATGVMAFAGLDLFRSVGPNVAVAIAVMLLCGMTFMPALMAVVGPAMWWPAHPEPHAGASRLRFWMAAGRLA